jgi:hypothetical protein
MVVDVIDAAEPTFGGRHQKKPNDRAEIGLIADEQQLQPPFHLAMPLCSNISIEEHLP